MLVRHSQLRRSTWVVHLVASVRQLGTLRQ
jgi:hypothetical protein